MAFRGFMPDFELVGLDNRADCITVTAAVTAAADNSPGFRFLGREHTACLLADGDIEVTDVTFDSVNLRVGHQLDIRALPDIHHLRCQDTLGTVKCRERLVEWDIRPPILVSDSMR